MTHLVYIGNKLTKHNKTITTIDALGKGLETSGYNVTYASSYKNIVFRFVDMLWTVFKHRKTIDYVLIDTYSTLNFYYAYAVSVLCQFFNLKYIPILHGGNLPKRLKQNPKLSQKLFGKAYINCSPSEYLKSSFQAFGYDNVKVIPNSITISNYPFNKRAMDTIRLLWVRSFSKLYNPKLAVDILGQLQKQGYTASLCMVGPDNDGSLLTTQAYAKSLNLDVTFTGKLSKDEWIALSNSYNLFINTTNFDNTPVSVIEAMALGLPIVSTNVGGLQFLVENEKEGVLVEPNNAKVFVNAIKSVISQPNKTLKMVENARKKSEKFDWECIRIKWKAILQ
ncbi:hypothetical protein GCM10022291_19180 [Postechiella marina]|uniref:Glycosyl transferase family 1 domain-containing protein n=1 Tax=Postechiella marina TaxID=943941 RepID=A0ABP8C990_9FLAO